MRTKIASISILALAGLVSADKDCRFATSFTPVQLLSNSSAIAEFKGRMLAQEYAFMKNIGFDKKSGLAKAPIRLNMRTGMPIFDECD